MLSVQNLEVVDIDIENGLVLVSGSVPGLNGGFLRIIDAVKHARPDSAPYPAALRTNSSSNQNGKDNKNEKAFSEDEQAEGSIEHPSNEAVSKAEAAPVDQEELKEGDPDEKEKEK